MVMEGLGIPGFQRHSWIPAAFLDSSVTLALFHCVCSGESPPSPESQPLQCLQSTGTKRTALGVLCGPWRGTGQPRARAERRTVIVISLTTVAGSQPRTSYLAGSYISLRMKLKEGKIPFAVFCPSPHAPLPLWTLKPHFGLHSRNLKGNPRR